MKTVFLILLAFGTVTTAWGQRGNHRYDYSIAGDKVVVSDFVEFENLPEEQILVNALLYFIQNSDKDEITIDDINLNAKRFVIQQQVISSEYASAETSYHYRTTFQVADDILSFNSEDIKVSYRVILKEFRSTPFEKLDPEKKPKHKVYLNEFIDGNSRLLSELFKFIRTNEYNPITYWDELKEGQLINGMNETECLILCGKPRHIRDTGSRVRWMFNNDFIVFFENGVISSIIK